MGVQSVRFGGRLEVGGRLCDDDGCDLSIGSSQATPVYYRASVSQSQSQSSLVPPPVCLSVCRSCPLSLAVWLPCWTDYLRIPTLHSRTVRSSTWTTGRLGLPSLTCSRFRHGCATERITYVSPARTFPSFRLVLFPSPGFRPKSRCRPDRKGKIMWTSKTLETGSRLTVA